MAIHFVAAVSKIQTLSDGGLRFTFDVDESQTLQAAELMECKRIGVVLTITAQELQSKSEAYDGREPKLEKGSKRKSRWQETEDAGTDGDTRSGG